MQKSSIQLKDLNKKNKKNPFLKPICAVLVTLGFLAGGCASKKQAQETVKTAYIHKYGVEVADEADFEARGGTGQIVRVQKNGVTIRQSYVKGKLEGSSSWTFPHRESIQRLAQFKDGVLCEETYHYVSGTPQARNTYNEEKLVGTTSWYEDGTPRAVEEYIEGKLIAGKYYTPKFELEAEVKNGHGVRVLRDGLGQLIVKEQFQQGALVAQTTFHSNGVPSAEIPYVHGKIHGLKKLFLPGGEPQQVEEWKEGVLDGMVTLYENGERVAQIPYKNGKKEGIEAHFTNNSNIVVEEITWKDDKKHGPSVIFVGGQKVNEWYYQGERVSKMQYLECVSPSYLTKE